MGGVGGGLAVTVLGCDGSYPDRGGACSGYLLRGGETTIWLDAGPGTLANLQRHVGIADVDAVVLSHEHPDHWSDLEGFDVACAYMLGRSGVEVYAPPGLREHVYHDTTKVFDWNVVEPGDGARIGDMTLSFSRTDHGPVTLAVRVDRDGSSFGYSADSGPGWSLEALGPGLDLAVCEASHTAVDEGKVQHMSARQAGASARSAGVGRLVLTHRWPRVDAADVFEEGSEAFGRPVLQASAGAEYAL